MKMEAGTENGTFSKYQKPPTLDALVVTQPQERGEEVCWSWKLSGRVRISGAGAWGGFSPLRNTAENCNALKTLKP